MVRYTIFARACDPGPAFLKAGGQHSDADSVGWVMRTCFNGLQARAEATVYRMISAGVSQAASTCVATDPMTRLLSVPWPCEPSMSMS